MVSRFVLLKGFPLGGSCHRQVTDEGEFVRYSREQPPHPLHFVQHLLLKEKAYFLLRDNSPNREFPQGEGFGLLQKQKRLTLNYRQSLTLLILLSS